MVRLVVLMVVVYVGSCLLLLTYLLVVTCSG